MGALTARALRSPIAGAVCLAGLVAAALLPPDGLPLIVCQFRAVTGLPCLGCGLTRSFIGMAHLDPGRAVFYHPAGVVLFPLVAITGLALFLPARTRDRMARWAESRGRMLNWTGGILLALFLFYGLGRLLLLLLSGRPSPW